MNTQPINRHPVRLRYWFELDLSHPCVTSPMYNEVERVSRKDKNFAGVNSRRIFFSFDNEKHAIEYRNNLFAHLALVGLRNNFSVQLTA